MQTCHVQMSQGSRHVVPDGSVNPLLGQVRWTLIDLHRYAVPVNLCRNAAPIDLCRDAAPIDLCRDAAPIDLCRDAAPIDFCKDAAPIAWRRDAAPIAWRRDAAPIAWRRPRGAGMQLPLTCLGLRARCGRRRYQCTARRLLTGTDGVGPGLIATMK